MLMIIKFLYIPGQFIRSRLNDETPPRNPPLLCDREADAALESAVHKWPLLILGVISVCCGLLYLGLYFWTLVGEYFDTCRRVPGHESASTKTQVGEFQDTSRRVPRH